MAVTEGEICTGVVTGITKFGAFVKLEDGTTGLVHISEIADRYVKEISDVLNDGDEVKVKVLNIGEGGKVALSIKKAMPKREPRYDRAERVDRPAGADRGERAANSADRDERFENKLAEFMKNSNEKLIQLKRHQEGRRR